MKVLRILSLLGLGAIFALAGCETLNQRDQSLLQQRHVSAPVYDKMMHNGQLTLADITELSKRGVPVPFIVNYLKSTGAVYSLNSSDVTQLVHDGVGRPVIDYMLSTPTLYRQQNYPYDYPAYGGYGPYPYYNYVPPLIFVPYRAYPHH